MMKDSTQHWQHLIYLNIFNFDNNFVKIKMEKAENIMKKIQTEWMKHTGHSPNLHYQTNEIKSKSTTD